MIKISEVTTFVDLDEVREWTEEWEEEEWAQEWMRGGNPKQVSTPIVDEFGDIIKR